MIDQIAACESEEADVLVIQLLEISVFDGVDGFILECLVHCYHILVDYIYVIVLKLELVLVGRGGILWHCGVYYWVSQFDTFCGL